MATTPHTHGHAHGITVDPRRLPDPGEPVPEIAWPTVALAAGSHALWLGSTALALAGVLPPWVAVLVNAVAAYLHFTVLHDAVHRTVSRRVRLNDWLGRLSGFFVAPPVAGAYSVFRYIHMQHHRFTNHDSSKDPDAYTGNGPAWTWPLRWATLDLRYYAYYLPIVRKRPRRDQVELALTLLASGAVAAAGIALGYGVELLVYWILPSRLSITFLGFAFDWLPHHGLEHTPDEDRYKTTRNRVGLERLMSPVLLYQNYHLVHHLHPVIPFYRYLTAWRRNEEAYLAHEPPLATVSGKALTVEDYRARRGLE